MKPLLQHDIMTNEMKWISRIAPSKRIRWCVRYVMNIIDSEKREVKETGMIRCTATAAEMAIAVFDEVEKIGEELARENAGLISFKYTAYKV